MGGHGGIHWLPVVKLRTNREIPLKHQNFSLNGDALWHSIDEGVSPIHVVFIQANGDSTFPYVDVSNFSQKLFINPYM